MSKFHIDYRDHDQGMCYDFYVDSKEEAMRHVIGQSFENIKDQDAWIIIQEPDEDLER